MPSYWANPQTDLPKAWKKKRIVFYAQGLKIYGQIPYLLQRRLQAEFYSNNMPFLGARLIGPSFEQNYTVVSYRRKDGRPHSQKSVEALLNWLYADKGFEWAIAKEFTKRIDLVNFWNWLPEVWEMGTEERRPELLQLLSGAPDG